ncbi:MAG: phenylalanine--tRNA ligase subunit beta [Verrucomicrobia bacterium]|nr:MAG: phenylalanine--tRNA ligase subunit beta [Verrucomicrobiota bacterium]PYK49620.1 MAG: phenylalanine--tRNA ligase subunit beta [Verrucomicrobiota bacterium]
MPSGVEESLNAVVERCLDFARHDTKTKVKFSVNWLREFVDLPKNPEEIAELLTRAGVETENIETRGAKIDNVIVSQITASSRHPNADRLTVCEVDDGSGTKRQIVCGATNYKVGDKVPLALPGAKLPSGTEIRKSKLRGVESEGMLCSPIELGVGDDASGLLILAPEAKISAPFSDLFPSDTIFDVEITPNRGDLLSHFGLAREIAALTNKKIVGQAHRLPAGGAPALQRKSVTISALRECPFFSARKIDNVKVGPSPQWLRGKIESVGIRSINNIVDISNFVMLELGQPTHAFDADRLRGGINVRLGREGEKFLALDGKTYSLTPDSCVVADQERAVGIGGVMGGEETGVTDSTKNILLEAAYFLPASIRRTARELNLPSDASYRFERGVDPEMVLRASQRATELIREIAGGTPGKEINVAGKLPANPPDVSLSCEKCNRVIGITLKPKTVDEILGGFGLRKMSAAKTAKWKIPSYRRDLQRDVDLIEEVVRAYGADKIPGTDRSRFTPASIADHAHDLESAWRERLAAVGLDEVRTSKLLPRERFAFSESAIELRNPLSEDHVALRPSILAGLLGVLDRNIRAGAERVAIFEIGRTFIPPSGKEERHVGILLWGNVASAPNWRSPKSRGLDLFDLKGALECVAPNLSFRQGKFPDLALPVDVFSSDRMIGFGGQLLAAKSTAPGAVFVAEVHADLLLMRNELATKFRDIEKFPAVTRDIAMIVPEETSHQKILRAIEEPREPLLEHVELFDLFSGGEIGNARKSLAYRLTYRDRSRTLTSEEVNAAHAKIRERLRRDLGAELRE